MLSDEEKKAIEIVNKRTERLIEELKIEEEDLIDEPKIAYLITQIEANKTLVNLIEKQSKEIEELKENYNTKLLSNAGIYQLGFNDGKKSVEDKIKAKIEEAKKNYNDLHTKHLRDCGIAEQRELAKIEFGQSLLEKE